MDPITDPTASPMSSISPPTTTASGGCSRYVSSIRRFIHREIVFGLPSSLQPVAA